MRKRIAIKSLNVAALCFVLSANAFACPVCRAAVNRTIQTDFWQTFAVLLLPLLLLAMLGVGLFYKNELQNNFQKIFKWHKTDFR